VRPNPCQKSYRHRENDRYDRGATEMANRIEIVSRYVSALRSIRFLYNLMIMLKYFLMRADTKSPKKGSFSPLRGIVSYRP
jgi:hypothetical protein